MSRKEPSRVLFSPVGEIYTELSSVYRENCHLVLRSEEYCYNVKLIYFYNIFSKCLWLLCFSYRFSSFRDKCITNTFYICISIDWSLSISNRFRFAWNRQRLINFHNTLKLILRPTVATSDAVYPLVFDWIANLSSIISRWDWNGMAENGRSARGGVGEGKDKAKVEGQRQTVASPKDFVYLG